MAMLKKKGTSTKPSRSKKNPHEDENEPHPASATGGMTTTTTTTSIKTTAVLTQHNTSSSLAVSSAGAVGGNAVGVLLGESTGNTPLARHKSFETNGKTPTLHRTTAAGSSSSSKSSHQGGLSSIHLMAMWENFQLEAEAQKRALKKKERSRLDTFKRHIASTITQLDPRLRVLPLERAIDEFDNDLEKALRAIVLEELNAQQQPLLQSTSATEMGGATTEKAGRKRCANLPQSKFASGTASRTNSLTVPYRKRVVGASPTRPTTTIIGAEGGPDPTSPTDPQGSIKKARETAASSATLGLGVPSSSRRVNAPSSGVRSVSGKRSISAHGSPSTAAPRQTRATARSTRPETTWRVRPSTASSSALVHNPTLSQTPHGLSLKGKGTQARAPRRGESILMRSINDSPLLGELVADESEVDDENEDGQGEEEQEVDTEWSMIFPSSLSIAKGKATSKGKTHVKDPKSKSKPCSSSVVAPSQRTFQVELPRNAPMYTADEARKVREQVEREVRERMVDELRKKLDETVLERGERERLLGVLKQL
ncbi:BQ2448_7708 [Microbotryum intermedium]|uniref:BQ2448_7708 protein n=1 Tax=Microbotryum intermedium TaxID=269621 RepID=A0A238FPI0_9BASI|nr:BQ2448_7708 [Microbotryum intermedium]